MKKPLLLTTYVEGPPDTDHYRGMIDDHASRHQSYAQSWGYERAVDRAVQTEVDGYWFKIEAIVRALKSEKYSHVFFLDTDAIIADHEIDLRDSLPKGFFLGMTVYPIPWFDLVHYQAGVMFIRSCQRAIDFFEAVLAMRDNPLDTHEGDQWVINCLLITQPEKWQSGLCHLTFPWNQIGEPGGSREPIIAAWHGCGSAAERRQAMRSWALQDKWAASLK